MYYPKLTIQSIPDYIIENTIDDKIEARENIENQTPISTTHNGETVNPEGEPAKTKEIKKFIPVTSSTARVMQPRKCYHQEYQTVCVESRNYYKILQDEEDEEDEENYYLSPLMTQIACVGAGLGGGYNHSSKLKTLYYPEAMTSDDKEEWMNEVEVEDNRMNKYNAWNLVPINKVPPDTKPLASIWVFKKKSSG